MGIKRVIRKKVPSPFKKKQAVKKSKAMKAIDKAMADLAKAKKQLKKAEYEAKTGKKVKFCPVCHGSGKDRVGPSIRRMQWGDYIKCYRCNSTGFVDRDK